MGISVVIPTFNRSFTIARTLDSLLSQTYREFDVTIVDDGSTDNTEEVVEPYLKDSVRYVRTSHRGTPSAWNLGVSKSREDHVLLAADDVLLDRNCLSAMEHALRIVGAEKLGGIGPRLTYSVDVYNSSKEVAEEEFAHVEPWSGDVVGSFDVEAGKVLRVPILHGYSLVQKGAFFDVGGFDERTYAGNFWREETDLWMRLRSKGYELYYAPEARMFCEKSLAKGGQWSNVRGKRWLYEYHVIRNHGRFLKKFYGNERFFMLPTFIIRRLYVWLLQVNAHIQHH